jgi:hypothetical protein
MRLRLDMLFAVPERDRMQDIAPPAERDLDAMIWPGGPTSDEKSRELNCIHEEMKRGVPNKLWDIGKD